MKTKLFTATVRTILCFYYGMCFGKRCALALRIATSIRKSAEWKNHLLVLTKDPAGVQKLNSLSSFQLRPSKNFRSLSLNLATFLSSRSCPLEQVLTQNSGMEQLISARPTGLNISWRTTTPAWATAIDSPLFMYDCSWNKKKKTFKPTTSQHRVFIHCCLRFPLTEQSSWQMPTQVTLDLVYWLVSFKGI